MFVHFVSYANVSTPCRRRLRIVVDKSWILLQFVPQKSSVLYICALHHILYIYICLPTGRKETYMIFTAAKGKMTKINFFTQIFNFTANLFIRKSFLGYLFLKGRIKKKWWKFRSNQFLKFDYQNTKI